MRNGNKTTGVRLRIVFEPDVALGPGKADLLEAIAGSGSIAAAGRDLGMSYKRAWSLVEAMNRDFRSPLVETTRGGKSFGGAVLTETGEQVLKLFRSMEQRASASVERDVAALQKLLNSKSG